MIKTDIDKFSEDIDGLLEKVVSSGERLSISTEFGNAVVMSEEDYYNYLQIINSEKIGD